MPIFRLRRTVTALCVLAFTLGGASAVQAAAATAATSATPSAAAPATGPIVTQDQALARAKTIREPVDVTAAESPTSELTANPNGTFTLVTSAQPVRKLVAGKWRPLDATLARNSGGTVAPALTGTPLTLSGGGTAPLATMHSGADSLSLTLPVPLPAPALSGRTATYHDVIPGVDLVVTVTTQGGFSDVYVIRDAAAAANPRLAALLTASVGAKGLTVGMDQSGDFTAKNDRGTTVFSAPAPLSWDSAGTASSVLAPGPHAHQGRLGARLSGTRLALTPDPAVLQKATYPVYYDPTWSGGKANWATVSANYPADPEWDKSAESEGLMQVGEADTGFWADTLINFDLPLSELGAEGTTDDIQSATFSVTNDGSDNCTKQTVDIYAPSATLTSSNATWDDWFTSSRNLGSAAGSASFADGWSSACPAASVGFGLSTAWISRDVGAGKSVQTLAMAGTSYSAEEFKGDGSGENDYHVFDFGASSPSLAITFVHAPAVPVGLYTTPNASLIGKGDVTLYAPVYDPDGGTLSTSFDAYVTGASSEVIKSGTLSAGSGATAVLQIPESTLDADVTSSSYGGSPGTTELAVSWYVSVSNGSKTATSAVQEFTYDTAGLGAPDIYLDSGDTTQCSNATGYTVGTPATFYFAPAHGQAAPTSYSYQLNDGEPVAVAATSGDASASITPTSQTAILTVSALNAAGNVGQTQSCTITASAAATEADGDLTGDGNADLLVPGAGTTSLPAGLWLAPGTGGGAISADAANIGLKGTGISTTESATQWDGTQVITGQFQGTGFNDVLDYDPTTNGTAGCSGNLLNTYGQALPLNPLSGGQTDVLSDVFTYYLYDSSDGQYDTPDCATSVAGGGNLNIAENNGGTGVVTSDTSPTIPDLLVVVDGSLFLEPEQNTVGNWAGLGSANLSNSVDMSDTNPSGSGTWAGWTITTTLAGDIPAMFAVSPSGAVYYYSPAATADLAYQAINGIALGSATGPVELAGSGFSGYANLQAAGFGGAPGLWATTAAGAVSTYLLDSAGTGLTELSSTPTTLVTANHDWALNDASSGTVTSAADTAASPLPLTTASGATWNDDDAYFAPDVALSGDGSGMRTSGSPLSLTGSFTVSAWASPASTGTTLLSQDGSEYSGLILGTTGSAWTFALNTGSGTAGTFDSVTGGSVQLCQWSQVTASYNAATSVMSLYVDGVLVATANQTAPSAGAAGTFHVGDDLVGGSTGSNFAGQVAEVQTWDQALQPITTPSPASYHYSIAPTRFMDTRTGLGGTRPRLRQAHNTALQIVDAATASRPRGSPRSPWT